MDELIFWIIIIALAIIIGNQTRERQDRETKGMSKRKKEKYFQDIKDKQWENTKTILFWIAMIILAFIIFIVYISGGFSSNSNSNNYDSYQNSNPIKYEYTPSTPTPTPIIDEDGCAGGNWHISINAPLCCPGEKMKINKDGKCQSGNVIYESKSKEYTFEG